MRALSFANLLGAELQKAFGTAKAPRTPRIQKEKALCIFK
jgi:hypothetical protein